MTETYIECGHTKITIHACGVNRSRKIVTFLYYCYYTNVNTNFMPEKVESTLVVLIL